MSSDETGVRLQIQAIALFKPGSAAIEPGGVHIVGFLADLAKEIDVPVVVSGHADNQPISTSQFASNWELSAVRAAGVARELVARGQDPMWVRVESFGEHQPVASNDTPEGRAQNRRVEFFYSRQNIIDAVDHWRNDLRPADGAAGTASDTAVAKPS